MGAEPDRGDVLVIGYGSDLRGDDALGPEVAHQVADLGLADVRVLTLPQLLPELAEDLAEVRLAIFVDARMGTARPAVEVSRIEPAPSGHLMTHATDPRPLLTLTRAVYGRAPEAWLLTVTGQDFGFRDGLSSVAARNARAARDQVAALIRTRRKCAVR